MQSLNCAFHRHRRLTLGRQMKRPDIDDSISPDQSEAAESDIANKIEHGESAAHRLHSNTHRCCGNRQLDDDPIVITDATDPPLWVCGPFGDR